MTSIFYRNVLTTCFALCFLNVASFAESNKPKPEPVDVKKGLQINHTGKYKGHKTDGLNNWTIRCGRQQNQICYTVSKDQGPEACDIVIQVDPPYGPSFRNVAPDCNLEPTIVPEFNPLTGEEVDGHLMPVPNWYIWDDSSQNWVLMLPNQNVWVQ